MSVYMVFKQTPRYHQISIEDFMDDPFREIPEGKINYDPTGTKTLCAKAVKPQIRNQAHIPEFIKRLKEFNQETAGLHRAKREDLYHHFVIPKRSGGLRPIDAPNYDLKEALRTLISILKFFGSQTYHTPRGNYVGACYHTSAFAYINKRCHIDAIKRHQGNESKWFMKTDFSNFFGSTTPEFVARMFEVIFPFSEVMRVPEGRTELLYALDLCFLNGGLPQGTPISPDLTNIIMIPIDFYLANSLRNFENQRFIYTRYADDMQISSRYDFDPKKVEGLINSALQNFGAPFTIKPEKTRYGSSSGRNWNLGVMLNKDNEITVGHKKKKQFQNMLGAYIRDKKAGNDWDLNDVQVMEGLRNYYSCVEKETIGRIIQHINEKYGVDVLAMIKADLTP